MISVFLQISSLCCVAFAQPAFCPWLGFFAGSLGLALFWKSLEKKGGKEAKKISFFWFTTIQAIQLSWMPNLEYQGYYIVVVYLLLCLGLGWQFSLLTRFLYFSFSKKCFSFLSIAGIWTLLEWLRLHVFCGFAFNFLGMSLSCNMLSLQMASICGVLGLSFWVVLTNLFAFAFFNRPSFFRAFQWGALAVAPYMYGAIHLAYHDRKSVCCDQKCDVVVIQTGLKPSQKYWIKGKESDFITPIKQWEKIIGFLEKEGYERPSLIVLPEAAVPFGLNTPICRKEEAEQLLRFLYKDDPSREIALPEKVSNGDFLQAIAYLWGVPIVVGLDYESPSGEFYNSAFYFDPKIKFLQRYDKQILLPLAEYIPFSWLAKFSKYYGIENFFSRGSASSTFSSFVEIAPSICYEELFSSLVRQGRLKGAQLLVNLSNDGYFPSSYLPSQHFSHGLIRTVENGVPLIRACNTGITGCVDACGRVVGFLQDAQGKTEFVSGSCRFQVPLYSYKTFFVSWGNGPLLWISLFFVSLEWVRKRSFMIKNARSRLGNRTC